MYSTIRFYASGGRWSTEAGVVRAPCGEGFARTDIRHTVGPGWLDVSTLASRSTWMTGCTAKSRFANSIDSCDLDIISMHLEGDGAQKLELFERPVEKVLRELISDIRLGRVGWMSALWLQGVLGSSWK